MGFNGLESSSAQFTTTSSTYVDVTDATITLSNESGGLAYVEGDGQSRNSYLSGYNVRFRINNDGTFTDNSDVDHLGSYQVQTTHIITDTDGSVYKVTMNTSSGTGYWLSSSEINALEVY